MTPQEILSEVQRAKTNLEGSAVIDQKREFVNNTYPLLVYLCEHLVGQEERFNEVEGALATLFLQSESVIDSDLAQVIQMALALSLKLCDEAAEAAKGKGEIMETITALRHVALEAQQQVHAVTVGPGDEDDEDEDDDDDDDTIGEDEVTPVEIPQPKHREVSETP